MTDEPYPFKPGDWVVDEGERVAKVKGVSRFNGDVYLDLYIYADDGRRIGRQSPAMGGPKTYEPCCSAEGWSRLKGEPDWPINVKWVPNSRGGVEARKWAGYRNPNPANYVPRKRAAYRFQRTLDPSNERLRKALLDIANGHNDARRRAKDALGLP